MSTNEPPPPDQPAEGSPPPEQPPSYPPPDQPPPGTPPPPPAGYPTYPQGGGAPPPAGYPPPADGGYPPGNYPPPTDPYGAGGGGDSRPYSVGEAFNWGWKKFQENIGTILVAAIIYFAILAVVNGVWYVIVGGVFDSSTEYNAVSGEFETSGGGLWAGVLAGVLFNLVYWVLQSLMQAGIVRGATEITHGRKPELATMFPTERLGTVLLAGVVVALMTAIGLVLCVIPGLIVLFYTQFTMFFVMDRGMGAIDAIKASAALVNQHVGTLVGFFFASLLAIVVGAIACLVGLVVAIPVVILAQAYTYRKLQGDTVAA